MLCPVFTSTLIKNKLARDRTVAAGAIKENFLPFLLLDLSLPVALLLLLLVRIFLVFILLASAFRQMTSTLSHFSLICPHYLRLLLVRDANIFNVTHRCFLL
jgi:hypothetical protein